MFIQIPEHLTIEDNAAEQLDKCQKYLLEQPKEQRDDLTRSLNQGLKQLGNLKATLYKDFAPLSFGFGDCGFVGGLIFHGQIDGYGSGAAPTFSCTLTPVNGWSIHT